MFSTIISAALLLTLAPSALAVGTAKVVNNCGSPVYFANVAQSAHASMSQLPSSGFSESYTLPGVGVSIKLSPSSTGKVTQFEYTWSNGNINYDISNIDGNPFADGGMALVPSAEGAAGFPSCKTVSCPAGQSSCSAAYNLPDDVRTMVCPDSSDLTMILCPNGPTGTSASPSTSSSPSSTSSLPISWSSASPSSTRAAKRDVHSHRVHSRQFR